MIYVEGGTGTDSGPMSVEAIAAVAKQHNVPVLVDAAPEILTVPNVHLQRGATLVAYSGGKVIRGPQSAGLLLGRKDLVQAGDEKIVANRLYEILSAKRPPKPATAPKPAAGDLTGTWKVDIQFAASKSTHTIDISQKGDQLQGTHQAEFRARELTGSIDGDQVAFATRLAGSEGVNIGFLFTGKLSDDSMSGTVDMGEYLDATWTARRHTFGRTRPTTGTGG